MYESIVLSERDLSIFRYVLNSFIDVFQLILYFSSNMKVIIINGPNLNLLGVREKSIYGNISFDDYFNNLKQEFSELKLEYFQSNIEGEIIDKF